MFDLNKIGSRIKSRRTELGLSLDDIATEVKTARSTIQRYETGKIIRPKIPVLQAIAFALKVNPDWLLGISDTRDITFWGTPPLTFQQKVVLVLQLAREKTPLTQEAVSKLLNEPAQFISDFERCKIPITADKFFSLLSIYGLKFDQFLEQCQAEELSPYNGELNIASPVKLVKKESTPVSESGSELYILKKAGRQGEHSEEVLTGEQKTATEAAADQLSNANDL